ncbi:hypothetical protein [Sediminibacterium sp.]|uniref:hypothetical protein n=1 Tax=Sediminibacterium sp. TaxID=1917865 RepID=UPI0027330460|nr:hypothetical protein [Sediminibacterium sp.]MDP3393361.1 hypothetical protein [Sediminibacterium sp.]MDP3567963.1 hypothetical protein [Sediminibacterium sp.]
MNHIHTIKLKALFLLVVFASNTAVGFACALGMDMDFNTSHHIEIAEVVDVHVHADGQKHVHEKENSITIKGVHEDAINQDYDTDRVKTILANYSKSYTKSPGGCCSDEVQKFQDLDKNVTVYSGIAAPVFVAILSTFLGIDLLNGIKDFPPKLKARFYYPPPIDILVAIQRFQI